MDHGTNRSELQQKIELRLIRAGIDADTEEHLLRVLSKELEITEQNLIGPVSPEESEIIVVDLSETQMHWMNVRFKHKSTFGMEVGKLEADLTVLSGLWTRDCMFVIIGEKKDGFVCWLWRRSTDGVLRICSPHLTSIAVALEEESVRATRPRRGARPAG